MARLPKKKNVIETEMYVLIFSTAFVWNVFSFQAELSEIWSKMYIGLHVKYSLFLSDFNGTWTLLKDFSEKRKYQIIWGSVQWEPSYTMRTDGQTDWQNEADSRFSQHCERA
jgi:hypothetical protein